MKIAIVALSALLAVPCFAQVYMGASFGYGQTGENDSDKYRSETFHMQQSTKSSTYGAFVGYRYGWAAIEGGALKLPEYFATMYTSDYTAYLGKDVGIDTGYAEDRVTANAAYLRGNFYLSQGALQPYITWGRTLVKSYQRTDGWYDQGTSNASYYRAEYRTTAVTSMRGFGVQYSADNLFGRVEYIQIPRATENPAIGRRDMQMVNLSVGWMFD
jgi:hypothetical protein